MSSVGRCGCVVLCRVHIATGQEIVENDEYGDEVRGQGCPRKVLEMKRMVPLRALRLKQDEGGGEISYVL